MGLAVLLLNRADSKDVLAEAHEQYKKSVKLLNIEVAAPSQRAEMLVVGGVLAAQSGDMEHAAQLVREAVETGSKHVHAEHYDFIDKSLIARAKYNPWHYAALSGKTLVDGAGSMVPLATKRPFCQAEVVDKNDSNLSRRASHDFSIFTPDVAGLDRRFSGTVA